MKILSLGSSSSQNRTHKNRNVRVDKQPNQGGKSYDGGEYVDYEEVN